MMGPHYFRFSREFVDGRRLCGECRLNYDAGDHIEVTLLKPFTKYVCPTSEGAGLGHTSKWTGAYWPELRRIDDDKCTCGATLVEEDRERWALSWEVDTGAGWRPVERIDSRHATHQQRDGLLDLIDQGELIRNVELTQLVTAGGAS